MAICSRVPTGDDCIVFSAGNNELIAANKSSSEVIRLDVGGDHVTCMTPAPQGDLFATCTNHKLLKIWNTSSWTCLATREVPKSATVLCFTPDGSLILVADKAGDVHSYLVADLAKEGMFLLGHLSMLLSMVLTTDQRYLITGDRDEKIRVSHYPNCYNIETYCLGHTDFVNCLLTCPQRENLLISGSGDGSVRVWEYQCGRLVHTVQCSVRASKNQAPDPVSCIVPIHSKSQIAVALENVPVVRVYTISADGLPVEACALGMDASPWSMTSCDHLWVCQPHQANPVVCFNWEHNNWIRSSCSNNILALCNNWKYFKGVPSNEGRWSQIRKQNIDHENVRAYMKRKEDRLKQSS